MAQFEFKDFHGISPVLYAFWDAKGRLDDDAMRHQVERCIAAGAHGITVLGLVTEIHKMSYDERLHLVRVVGSAIAGRVPYSVTVGEPTIEGQVAFVGAAAKAGADWVVLQPPPTKGIGEAALVDFFATIARKCAVPVAIQNNPVNLDVWLSNDALADLVTENPKITLVKGEGSALSVAALAKRLGPAVGVFAGHGGVEFTINMAGGCVGLIPAPELLDRQVAIYDLWKSGGGDAQDRAREMHGRILPWIVMVSRAGVEPMLFYGKRLMAARLGLPTPTMRAPTIEANEFGLSEVEQMLELLGPL